VALRAGMMVYGDSKFEEELSSVVARVGEQAARATSSTQELRTLLIQSGQLEQGVEDYWGQQAPSERSADILKGAEHTFPKRVLVVGIRSIGTTLSAVVEATLMSLGWEVQRLTVRPSGHPFSRKLNIKPPDAHGIKCALIVDEGPGISGSSMASVAEWLGAAGVSDVAFFPGHENGPGTLASAEVRRCWEKTPRYFTPLEELRWDGRSLADELGRRFAQEHGSNIDDLSSGKWREWSSGRRSARR